MYLYQISEGEIYLSNQPKINSHTHDFAWHKKEISNTACFESEEESQKLEQSETRKAAHLYNRALF